MTAPHELAGHVNKGLIRQILAEQSARGADFPRFAIFVIAYKAARILEATLKRIPEDLLPAIEEIFVIDDFSDDETYEIAQRLIQGEWKDKLKAFRNPRNYGYGGTQKVGFKYAIERGFDYVILLHADGQYAPEYLPNLMAPVLFERKQVVFGSRMIKKRDALASGMPLYRFLGNVILTAVQNNILNSEMSEYHCGYRLYSCAVLKRIPFEENTDAFHFDTQVIIQCMILEADIHEVPVPTYYGEEISHVNGLKYAFHVCKEAIGFRLHQLHIVRSNTYLARGPYDYQLKRNKFSSHKQIARLVQPGSRVLDLGCSQGFMAMLLRDNNVHITGIDLVPPQDITGRLDRYYQWDINNLETLQLEREFDYIILADVVEHLVNGKEVLMRVRRYLRPDGRLIVSTGNVAVWFYRLSLFLGRFQYGPRGILDETHVKLYTVHTFRHLVTNCGYKIVKEGFTPIPFELVFSSRGRSRLLEVFTGLYHSCTCFWPNLFAYQCIFEAEVSSLDFSSGESQITAEGKRKHCEEKPEPSSPNSGTMLTRSNYVRQ